MFGTKYWHLNGKSKENDDERKDEKDTMIDIGDPTEIGEESPMVNYVNGINRNILNIDDYKIIFSDLQLVYSLNCQFYLSIKSVIESKKWINKPQISDPFDRFTPLFSMYSNYMNNYNFKIECVNKNYDKNKKFIQFCDKAREDCNGQKLCSLIILPIQRLPRYKLILNEILKNTENDHKDYTKLSDALINLSKITHLLNAKIGEYESRMKVNEIARRFENKTQIGNSGADWSVIKPYRKFIKEGYLNKIDRKGKSRKYTFLLFNDCLIYATHSNINDQTSKLTFHQELPINNVFSLKNINSEMKNKFHNKVKELNELNKLNESNEIEKGFEIHSCIKSFIVYADSKIEKEGWIDAITNVMIEYHNQAASSWQDDDDDGSGGRAGKGFGSNDKKQRKTKRNIKIDDSDIDDDKDDYKNNEESDVFGAAAPLLLPDDYFDVCMVQGCETKFSKVKRKYHCKKCGYIICGKCTNKIRLNKITINPVCPPCQLSCRICVFFVLFFCFDSGCNCVLF